MTAPDHPFQPGVRVAVREGGGWAPYRYREAFVEKVLKNGNVTLRGDRQQWRPFFAGWGSEDRTWEARQTGTDRHRGTLIIWDETTDRTISEQLSEQRKADRLRKLQQRIERLTPSEVTNEALAQIEAALPAAGSP